LAKKSGAGKTYKKRRDYVFGLREKQNKVTFTDSYPVCDSVNA
jgi:CRISPR/Cas system CMR subunit Cmr6 (Cas7 group RAMP superfamily)